jgi:hypothetical protein
VRLPVRKVVNRAKILESKLQGDIAQLEELLDIAEEHNTPFVDMLAQALDAKRARLAQLVGLQTGGHGERGLDAFLTPREKEAFGAIERVLDSERIRLNLLLASLYLAAFEVLKSSIIDRIEEFFVHYPGTGSDAEELHARWTSKYEQEVGKKYSALSHFKLIPSCKWLQKNGVLDEEEIGEIRGIRDHRNNIAHDLPELIFSEDFLVVDLDRFVRIRELLGKVELFWTRVAMDIMGSDEVPDEDIVSGREMMLDVIIGTVTEYLGKMQDIDSV